MTQEQFYLGWLIVNRLNKQDELDIVYEKTAEIYSIYENITYCNFHISGLDDLKNFVEKEKELINTLFNQ